MEDDQPKLRQRAPEQFGSAGGDVLVGDAVEAVSADLMSLDEVCGKRIRGRRSRQGAVERGVEHRDVRDVREGGARSADAGQVDRVVQRSQGGELVDLMFNLVSNQRSRCESVAAVHDAVADDRDALVLQSGQQRADHGAVLTPIRTGVAEPLHDAAPDRRARFPVDQSPLDRG